MCHFPETNGARRLFSKALGESRRTPERGQNRVIKARNIDEDGMHGVLPGVKAGRLDPFAFQADEEMLRDGVVVRVAAS